jgi:hypothetical protein
MSERNLALPETARSGQNNRLEAYFTLLFCLSSDVPRPSWRTQRSAAKEPKVA